MEDVLRRVTDLFVEGAELPLGMDDDGNPVVLWINKLNSFETEEARRDGVAARGLRMLALSARDNPELKGQRHIIEKMSDQDLRAARVEQMGEETYLRALNDIEADPEWAEKVAMIRRLPSLISDGGAGADDPRLTQLQELNSQYIARVRELIAKAEKDALADLEDVEREKLEEDYLEAWRQRLTLDDFMAERRITELFYALRICQATEKRAGDERVWDHEGCDHSQRWLAERDQVRTLPDGLLRKVIDVIDGNTVGHRESGNSDALASSSASSEPSSPPAETSAPSTPAETPPAAPTT